MHGITKVDKTCVVQRPSTQTLFLQDFDPDLALLDVAMVGGQALADKLGIPAAVLCIAGDLGPITGHTYGSGVNLLSTVPQWQVLVPRHMVGSVCCSHYVLMDH